MNSQKCTTLFVLILIGLLCIACQKSHLTPVDVTPFPLTVFPESLSTVRCSSHIDNKDRSLWAVTVRPYLEEDLWIDPYLYDAAHYLMVPLHAAFALNEQSWLLEFESHFKRFVEAVESEELEPTTNKSQFARLHYFYLSSRFVVLAKQSAKEMVVPVGLVDILYDELDTIWHSPAWMWGREPFPTGMAERIEWKLNTFDVPYSYYRGITDEELFVFALAADLRAYERLTGYQNESSPLLSEILTLAQMVFESEVRVRDSGWLFQPGVWREHPDGSTHICGVSISPGHIRLELADESAQTYDSQKPD